MTMLQRLQHRLKIVPILVIIVYLITILLSFINGIGMYNYIMYVLNYVIIISIILYLIIDGLTDHYLAIAFYSCFLLFLMSQKVFKPEYDVYLTFVRLKLDANQYFEFSIILFIGISLSFISYLLGHKMYERKNYTSYKNKLTYLGKYTEYALLVTLPCACYMQYKTVFVRSSMEYTEGYLINVEVPTIIKIGYYLFIGFVFVYLSTKPSRAKMIIVLMIFLFLEGGLQLIQGRRAMFASTFLFAAWYLIKYFDIRLKNPKLLIPIVTVGVFIIAMFYFIERARDNKTMEFSLDFIKNFLISTGGSDSVIANTIVRKDLFPGEKINYLFDPFFNNYLGNKLLHKDSVPQGIYYLMQHSSFSHWLSYLTNPNLYLTGHGMGSCYLAEVYLSLGYIGVAIVSAVLGLLLCIIDNRKMFKCIYIDSIIFFVVKRIFTLPRDSLFSGFGDLLYLLFVLLLITPLIVFLEKRKKAGVVNG